MGDELDFALGILGGGHEDDAVAGEAILARPVQLGFPKRSRALAIYMRSQRALQAANMKTSRLQVRWSVNSEGAKQWSMIAGLSAPEIWFRQVVLVGKYFRIVSGTAHRRVGHVLLRILDLLVNRKGRCAKH